MDDLDLARQVVARLGNRTLATAESCTAGRVAEAFAAVEHASRFLRGGLVAYQPAVKRELLGVTASSVVSAVAAEEMAVGGARLLDSDVAVATTGVAGDESEDGVPPGTVFIAVSVDGIVSARRHRFDGTPEEVCDRARTQALRDVLAAMSTVDQEPLVDVDAAPADET
jgi:PncC family amidohydrolase